MVSRREFLKLSGASAGALMALRYGLQRAWAAPIAGGTLPPGSVAKFAAPLVKPPAMPGAFGKNKDKFKIAMRQFQQQILPDGLPKTTVWSYGPSDAKTTTLVDGFFYPAFTVEATANKVTQVVWKNELVDAMGNYLPHLLPVDPTLHWANPPGGVAGRDKRPTYTSTPGSYTGPVPMITHVHGAHVAEESDGYPEAWFLPNATNIPAGYATTGTFYDYFNTKYKQRWSPGTASFKYTNDQPATTLWYHDHTLGMTRVNVYAGPAGFWLIRGGEYDHLGLDYVAPGVGDDPFGEYTEIPIAIQDRSFGVGDDEGALFYPDTREFFDAPDGWPGPYIPDSLIAPIWNPEFFGNMMVVNGRTWPYLEVEKKRYRFRLLNGCNSRFLFLKLTQTPRGNNSAFNTGEYDFLQIGGDQGFLPTSYLHKQLLMAPAERADVIVDFSSFDTGTEIFLVNDGPDAPFGGISEDDLSDYESTGLVMKFIVTADDTLPMGVLPTNLPAAPPLGPSTTTQEVTLNEEEDPKYPDAGPAAALLGAGNAPGTGLLWSDNITEIPNVGDTETFEIYNFTADAHPIHVHLVHFEVVNRQPIDGNGETTGDPYPPELWESGYKDTVITYPGELTRIKAKFDLPGLYVWHCHIVEHEDNEMMRPYYIGPIDPNAPLPDNAP